MAWELEYQDRSFQIQARLAKGLPLPDWALNEPEIVLGGSVYLTAFYHLCTCRQTGADIPGPIPWRDVLEYAKWHGIADDYEVFELFAYVINRLDAVYLDCWAKKVQKANGHKSIQHSNRV